MALAKMYQQTNWDKILLENENCAEEILNEVPAISENQTKKTVPNCQSTNDQTHKERSHDLIEIRKQRIKKETEIKKQNEYLKKIATNDLIADRLEQCILSVPPINIKDIKYPKNIKFTTRPQEALLLLSDLHVGLAVLPEEVGGIGDYNLDIFKRRLDNLVKKVIKITGMHRKTHKVDKLNIFMLGDLVHGMNDSGSWGHLYNDLDVIQQVFEASKEIKKAILSLNQFFPEINVHCVIGNHSRTAHKGKEKPHCNWDYILYHDLEKGLRNQSGIKFHIPKAIFHVAEVLGKKFLLTHGDQIRAWSGIPFYGLVRAENNFRNLLTRGKTMEKWEKEMKGKEITRDNGKEIIEYILNWARTFDYFVVGHFHQMAELESDAGGRTIMNASFIGGDSFSINSLLKASTPAQKFFGVHKEGISWRYDIELDRD